MPGWIATILLVSMRVSALLFVAPGLSSNVVPWRMRVTLCAALIVPVLCIVPAIVDEVPAGQFASLLLHEAVVGVSLALFPAVLIWGLQMGTTTLQGMTGLPGGQDAATNDFANGPPLQRFLLITVLTIFFLSSGHRRVVQAVLSSFAWLPPGQFVPLSSAKELLLDLFAQSFALGVQAMAPVAGALFMSLMAVAALNRLLPQLGYFAVGMSVQTLVLLGALVVGLGSIGMMLEGQFDMSADLVSNWLQTSQPVTP